MRLTAGGDRLPYDGKKSAETAGLETTIILINSVVSTPEPDLHASTLATCTSTQNYRPPNS
eukprot:scaffold142601_cov51-Attheya_sp.AAC.3